MNIPIALPLDELVPPPELFVHQSTLHGQAHVARVMVHAFRLLEATGHGHHAPRLWAAVYLHDIARTHDGRCYAHGASAVNRLERLAGVQALFERGGVLPGDGETIATAVTHHCLPDELPQAHPCWELTALLKDADGLDRVRLGDLDPSRLRYPEARLMVDFAEELFAATDGIIAPGRDHFARLWTHAARLAP